MKHLITSQSRSARRPARRLGYTLAELMVALSIFTFCSTAISSLMFATYNTNRWVRSSATNSSQAEIALRRIVENLRSAVDVVYSSTNGLMIQTPPDSDNLSYISTYQLRADPYHPGHQQLYETIQRADTLGVIQDVAIVADMASFTATRTNPGAFPEVYQLNIVLAGNPAITRTCTVTGRNLVQ